jgi:hypothetical protein
MSETSLREMALADLARSGLTSKDFKRLAIQTLTSEQTEKLVGKARPSYKIPYFESSGKINGYYRVRFLSTKKGRFAKLTERGQRYGQPSNSAPHVYFPPYVDWRAVAKDTTIPIVITEGEKKAAIACKLGITTLAIGGVWSFMASKRGLDFIPQLEEVAWDNRVVEICYDSDVMWKADVRKALDALCDALMKRGPQSISRVFFDGDQTNNKIALDDFLVEHGAKGYEKLKREPYKPNIEMRNLNERLAYIESEHNFYDIEQKRFFRSLTDLRACFANHGRVATESGSELIINAWIESPERRSHSAIVYEPGSPTITKDNAYNVWKAPTVKPTPNRPDLWLDLVHHIMRKPEYADWFIKWLAYPLQHPGVKLYTAVFVHSRTQGVGKTFIVDPVMEPIYGTSNFYRVSNDELQSTFNSFVARRQFIVANEVYLPLYKDRASFAGMLNDMITREKVSINEKYQPRVVYQDRANYYLTSNHADALPLDEADRRFFVIEAPNEPLSRSDYEKLNAYVRGDDPTAVAGPGLGDILHYLQHVDLSDFNPRAQAPKTIFRQQVVNVSASPVTHFARQLAKAPHELLATAAGLPKLQLWRVRDLLYKLDAAHPGTMRNLTEAQLAYALKGVNIPKRKVRMSEKQPQFTLYAILNAEHWLDQTNKAWADHYTQHGKVMIGEDEE